MPVEEHAVSKIHLYFREHIFLNQKGLLTLKSSFTDEAI